MGAGKSLVIVVLSLAALWLLGVASSGSFWALPLLAVVASAFLWVLGVFAPAKQTMETTGTLPIPGGNGRGNGQALLRLVGWLDGAALRVANEGFVPARDVTVEVRTGATTFFMSTSATALVPAGVAVDIGALSPVGRPFADQASWARSQGRQVAQASWRNPDGAVATTGWQTVDVVPGS